MALKVRQKRLASDYAQSRTEDLRHYLNRSDLSVVMIAASTGIPLSWLNAVKFKKIQCAAEDRVSLIIDFVKDFERLQTYYAALSK